MKLQNIFRDLFIAYGVSEVLRSDRGPQFMAENFHQFLKCGVSNIDSHRFHTHNLMAVLRPPLNQQSILIITIYWQMEA